MQTGIQYLDTLADKLEREARDSKSHRVLLQFIGCNQEVTQRRSRCNHLGVSCAARAVAS